MKNYKIAVAGTGYVGLSLSVLLAQHNQVMAVDIVQAKVDMINNHKSPIQDDYIEKYLAEKELNLTATLDAKAACTRVGIPARYNYIRTLDNIEVNRLYILDDEGDDQRGSYYLGQYPEFYTEKAVIELITKVTDKYTQKSISYYA